jgi:ribosomal protein L34E
MCHLVRSLTAIRLALAARRDLLLGVLALHHQLAVLARSNRRFRTPDASAVAVLARGVAAMARCAAAGSTATGDRWHRDRFDWRWWRRSRRPGRPRIDSQVRNLIRRVADENRL